MTLRQAFAGMLQLLAVVALFGAALFFVAAASLAEFRFTLARLLLEKPDVFAAWGIVLFVVAFLMTMGFLGVNRGRFLLLRMGGQGDFAVDTLILRKTIVPLLQKQFAARIALHNVEVLREKELAIGLTVETMDPLEQEKLLLEAEKHLKKLLVERFGYRDSFAVQAVNRS